MSEIKVRKANKIVRVTENELAKYLANGYVRLDTVSEVQKAEPRETVREESKQEEVVKQTRKRK